MGGLASAYTAYSNTKGMGLIYAGRDLWPEYMDMKPSDVMLAVGAVTSFLSGGLLIAGLFPKVGLIICMILEKMKHADQLSGIIRFDM